LVNSIKFVTIAQNNYVCYLKINQIETANNTLITVQATIKAPIEKVWDYWTNPAHIIHWCSASDDWHAPYATNDLKIGGKCFTRMEAKDGSMGFDFIGVYTNIKTNELIEYTLEDGRKVKVEFANDANGIKVTESFEAEKENPVEMQQAGWQAILDNFKLYTESTKMEKLHFEVTINASASKIFERMFDDTYYREWTAAFNPTSYFKGKWAKGEKMLFLGTDSDGNEAGMVSSIYQFIPNKFVSIQHLGLVKGKEEITSGPEVEDWAGIFENYSFTETNGTTNISVDIDTNEEFKSYFIDIWPKALDLLKTICEK
jgi:uncharacterized protein YndB with AHSA1/START domain